MTRLFVFVMLFVALWFVGRGVAWLTYQIFPDIRDDEDRYGFMSMVGILAATGLVSVGLLLWGLWDLAGAVSG